MKPDVTGASSCCISIFAALLERDLYDMIMAAIIILDDAARCNQLYTIIILIMFIVC